MENDALEKLQQRVSQIKIPYFKDMHSFPEVPKNFVPWSCGLSPSELYARSLPLRKKSGIKAIEVRWVSIKRWSNITPGRIELPDGVFLSIKRKEVFVAFPKPHYEQVEFVLIMLPYGNVWSQIENSKPITEDWLFSDAQDGKLVLEHVINRDAAGPIKGYWGSVYKQWKKEFTKQQEGRDNLLWIHTKRKKPI